MKVIKYTFFLVLLLCIGLAIYIAVQPNSFEVKRTKLINAPAGVVYENVIDFKNWQAWSSWEDINPEMKITFSENTRGIGGSYSWEDSNGKGTMKTVDTKVNETIVQVMQFEGYPESEVTWNLKSNKSNKTEVTWTIRGKDLPFAFKAFSAFTGGMEKQIGPSFERSLEKLDSVLISNMKAYSIKVDGVTQHSGGFYLYKTASCKTEDFQQKMPAMMAALQAFVASNNLTTAGKPFVIYHRRDEANKTLMFSCGIPTPSQIVTTNPEILTGQLEPFKAVKTVVKGDYVNLKEAWTKTKAYCTSTAIKPSETGPMLESYITDAKHTPNPAKWVTELYLAVN